MTNNVFTMTIRVVRANNNDFITYSEKEVDGIKQVNITGTIKDCDSLVIDNNGVEVEIQPYEAIEQAATFIIKDEEVSYDALEKVASIFEERAENNDRNPVIYLEALASYAIYSRKSQGRNSNKFLIMAIEDIQVLSKEPTTFVKRDILVEQEINDVNVEAYKKVLAKEQKQQPVTVRKTSFTRKSKSNGLVNPPVNPVNKTPVNPKQKPQKVNAQLGVMRDSISKIRSRKLVVDPTLSDRMADPLENLTPEQRDNLLRELLAEKMAAKSNSNGGQKVNF